MMTIFCCHLSYLVESPFQRLFNLIDYGRFGVNFFLVLSGFVLALGYSTKLDANNRIQDITFIKKKDFKNIYTLPDMFDAGHTFAYF